MRTPVPYPPQLPERHAAPEQALPGGLLDAPLTAALAFAAAALPALLLAGLLGALLALLLGATPAHAQSFFAESDVLREDSSLQLTFSQLVAKDRTDDGVVVDYANRDAVTRMAQGRLRWGVLGLGALAESRRFQETTPTYALTDDRDRTSGYGALVFGELLTDSDALFLVGSSGRRDETFAYNAYRRKLTSQVPHQWGLMYRIGFLVAGYIRGHETIDLELTDLATVAETYDFDYTARMAALVFGDPSAFGLLLVWQRKETPAVPGTTVSLEAGYEELHRATLGLGAFYVDYAQTQFLEAFTGDSRRESTEREATLGFGISQSVSVSLSQKRTEDAHGFTLAGLSSNTRTERTENLVRVGFHF